MPTVVDQAVCIRQWEWSETSQTVSLFGREVGLFRGLAKGARRKGARFSGGLETLTSGEAVAIIKPGPVLATLTAWDLRETFPALRASLTAFHAGLFLADLVQHALTEHDPHPAVYDAMTAALRGLGPDEAGNLAGALRFQWLLLSETGYRPDLASDVLTGGPLAGAALYGFAPLRGGVTADPRAPGHTAANKAATEPRGTQVWRVRAQTIDLLRAIDSGAAAIAADADALRRANRLLAAYLREVLGRDLPAAGPFLSLPGGSPPEQG
ncbi:MAG: DNA repair protein RecO [Phycisphaerales bacterium]|nr:DNA repair protein RecO [Phycisphaerales bacterium]